jgi:three-Cys-motif partner protein
LGSPLVALTANKLFDSYFLVDKSEDNIQALRKRCEASPVADRVRYFAEDCNVAVDKIARIIQDLNHQFIEDRWSCLNLAFLDPYGLELEWSTVKTLAELRTDLIIHYSQMGLQRYMPVALNEPGETIVDRFFGTRRWREVYERGKPWRYGELIDLYKHNLTELGYIDVRTEDEVCRVPMMRNTKNAPLYCLVFASKSDLGERFWREVTNRDVYGQQRLF